MTMRLGIIGSRRLANHPEVWRLIRRLLHQHRPDEVISGGADGVDSMAIRAAADVGITARAFYPEVHRWDGGERIGLRQRDWQIVQYCSRVIRITALSDPEPARAWAFDQAVALGKSTRTVDEFVINA